MNGFSSRTCFCFWSVLLSLHAISRQAASPTGCRPPCRTIGPAVSCFWSSCSLSPRSSTISPRHLSARPSQGTSSRAVSASATSQQLSPRPTPAARAASSATPRRPCCGSPASAPFRASCLCRGRVCAVRLGHPGIAAPNRNTRRSSRIRRQVCASRSGTSPWSSSCSLSAIAANVGAHLLDAHILDEIPADRARGRSSDSPDRPDRAT